MSRRPSRDPFLERALAQARKGLSEGGIPIGSVLVRDGEIVGEGRNRRVQEGDPTAHAEIDCLRRVGRLGSYRGAVLYSTLMPCFLCAGAIVQFAIRSVVAGESRNFAGAAGFLRERGVTVVDLDDAECAELLARFVRENPKLWDEDVGR